MLNVNVYLFVLSGDSLANCVEVRSNETPLHEENSTKELTKLVEELRKEVFCEIASAAISDSDPLDWSGDRVEKLRDKYSDMLRYCLEYVGCWAVEKDKMEIFLDEAFDLDAFLVACGRAFMSGRAGAALTAPLRKPTGETSARRRYGTAWTAVFEVHNTETGALSYRIADIRAEI